MKENSQIEVISSFDIEKKDENEEEKHDYNFMSFCGIVKSDNDQYECVDEKDYPNLM